MFRLYYRPCGASFDTERFRLAIQRQIPRRNYRIYDMLNFDCVSGLCIAAFRNFAEAMVFHKVPQPKTDTGEAADTHLQDLCYIGGPRANLGVAVPQIGCAASHRREHVTTAMSALGQKRTFAMREMMSALTPKADMCSAQADVRFVPQADMTSSSYSMISRLIAAPRSRKAHGRKLAHWKGNMAQARTPAALGCEEAVRKNDINCRTGHPFLLRVHPAL